MNSSPDAPWKDGSEQSERWKETLGEGFLPRVSDGTGSPGGGGQCQGLLEIINLKELPSAVDFLSETSYDNTLW